MFRGARKFYEDENSLILKMGIIKEHEVVVVNKSSGFVFKSFQHLVDETIDK